MTAPAPRPRRRPAAALALSALLASAALAGGPARAEAPAPDPDMVVAAVNGAEITLAEIILMRAALPAQFQALPDDMLFEALVDQAVNQVLLAEAARAEGLADSRAVRLRLMLEARGQLAEAGLSRTIDAAVTDEALRAAYEARFAGQPPVREVRAAHILVPEREAAEALLAELADGAAFADLAAEHGTDGTRSRGGDLGWFGPGQMVGPFEEAAFAAPLGQAVGPVETQFGWHLILVSEERDRPAPAFEDVRDELANTAAAEAASAAIAALRETAQVTRPEALPEPAAIRRDDLLDAD